MPSPAIFVTPTAPSEVDCVAGAIDKMSVQALAGQVIMVGAKAASPTSVVEAVGRYQLGGVFLTGHTTQRAAAVAEAVRQLQVAARGTRLMIAVDQEGGTVQTLGGKDFPPILSALKQGALPVADLRTQTGQWAAKLAAAGITLDLAPVADVVPVNLGEVNKPIGALHRQYGSNPAEVAADISVVVSALQDAGVRATLKHFPGLGRVQDNTDFSESVVDNVTTVDDPFLEPFRSGIRAGADAVMISSAIYARIDAKAPAVFSRPVITDVLRGRLGFGGLVVSDDLGRAAAVSDYSAGDRAVRFIEAGGDLILTVTPAVVGPMVVALVLKARTSAAFAAQLRNAVAHVLHSKYRAGLFGCGPRP